MASRSSPRRPSQRLPAERDSSRACPGPQPLRVGVSTARWGAPAWSGIWCTLRGRPIRPCPAVSGASRRLSSVRVIERHRSTRRLVALVLPGGVVWRHGAAWGGADRRLDNLDLALVGTATPPVAARLRFDAREPRYTPPFVPAWKPDAPHSILGTVSPSPTGLSPTMSSRAHGPTDDGFAPARIEERRG